MGSSPQENPGKCALCGRDVHKATETLITFDERKEEKACCIKCAFKYEGEISKKASSIKVADFDSGEIVEAEKAYYVSGSNVTPCCSKKIIYDERKNPFVLCYDRCLPSLLAFKVKDKALKFIGEHGGKILAFKELEPLKK